MGKNVVESRLVLTIWGLGDLQGDIKLKRGGGVIFQTTVLCWIFLWVFRIEAGIKQASYIQFRMNCFDVIPRLHTLPPDRTFDKLTLVKCTFGLVCRLNAHLLP